MKPLHTTTLGCGETLVLIHGWGMHSGIWRDFAENLAESYQVVCVDLPGHGQSDLVDPYTLGNITQQVAACVSGQPCYWLGWSLGAAVVLEMVKLYPQRVQALILMAGNPHFLASKDWPGMDALIFEKFRENVLISGDTAVLKFLMLQLSILPDARAELKILKQVIEEFPMPKVEALLGGLEILAHQDLRCVLQTLELPVQIILGDDDNLVPVATGAAMLALQPTAQIEVIEKAGHMPFLSHQQQVLSVVKQFLKRKVL